VTVNPGGGSGWDEPPLDIQIPDDARELDRDVLAYHRELRAKRRRNRLKRLARPFGPLAARGTVMPLLASILAVCLVAGAMLSVATFSPATTPAGQKHPNATAPPRSTASSRPSATGTAAASNTATGTASNTATGTAAASNAGTGTASDAGTAASGNGAIGPVATGTAAAGTSATGPGAARTAASGTSGPQASHSVSPSASSGRTRPAVRASGSGLAAAPR
jgi:cytoskeletal protein RodZ